MLIPFACIFTDGPKERAITNRQLACSPGEPGTRSKSSGGGFQASPLIDVSFRPAGLTKETRYLLGSVSILRVGSCLCPTPITGGVDPRHAS